jgi:bifunctional DNase/RNase
MAKARLSPRKINRGLVCNVGKIAVPLLFLASGLLSVPAWSKDSGEADLLEVQVYRVFRDSRSLPVVILADARQSRGMMIWIGEAEAMALEAARQGVPRRRPMTHDLLTEIMKKLRGRILQVRITELRDDVYYARIVLDVDGEQHEVDARPSDSMVLATQAGSPIMVSRSLFERQAIPLNIPVLERYGLGLQELTGDLKEALQYDGDGLLVAQVEPDSPALRDGFRPKDILVKASGKSISQLAEFEKALMEATDILDVRVYRDGAFKSLTLRATQEP